MAVKDKEIDQPVVIVIKEAAPEAAHRQTNQAQSQFVGRFDKQTVLFIVKESVRLSREVRHENLLVAIAIKILSVRAHAATLIAIRIESHACGQCYFRKTAVAFVVVKKIRRGIVS